MTLKRKNEIKLRLTDKELEQLNEDVKKTGYSRESIYSKCADQTQSTQAYAPRNV